MVCRKDTAIEMKAPEVTFDHLRTPVVSRIDSLGELPLYATGKFKRVTAAESMCREEIIAAGT